MTKRLALLAWLLGCAGAVRVPGPSHSAPTWAEAGSGARREADEAVFVGVGVAAGLADPTLASSTADSRAVAEVASSFDAFARRVALAYRDDTDDALSADELVTLLAATTLSAVVVSERSLDDDGTAYALATLPLSRFLADLRALETRAPKLSAFVRERADSLFDPTSATPAAASGECSAVIDVSQLTMSSRSCFVDERVSTTHGRLVYPCAGGTAEATFGDARFTGLVAEGRFELLFTSAFDYADGCRWRSTQRLSGELRGNVAYEYDEAPAEGKDCESACRANGSGKVR